MSEIGSATFGLVVGLGRFRKELKQGEQVADRAGDKIGDELIDGATDKVEKGSGKITAALGAVGVAGGAALGLGFAGALDFGAGTDKLAASLDLTGAEAERAGDTAGRLYADAYGESLEEVNGAVAAVISTLGEFAQSDADLERLTGHAMNFAEAMDQDVAQSVGNAGVLIETGLARDADHAFDLMTASMKKVPVAVRDELMAATHEYSQFFAGLGLDGEQSMGILVEASKGGTFMLDKLGDALKEVRIKAADTSTTTSDAYKTLGLNADVMRDKMNSGGADAKSAFDAIVSGLLGIEDPSLKANTAIALFGAPFEDISGDAKKTDELLRTLAAGGMTDVGGKATEMGEILNDNAKTGLTAWGRTVEMAVVGVIDGKLIPAIEGLPGPLRTATMGLLGTGVAGAGMAGDFGMAAVGVSAMGGNLKAIPARAGQAIASMGRMSATAVTAGARTAGAWALSAAGAARATALTVGQLALQGAKWLWLGVQSLIGAGQVAAAWLLSIWPIALIIAAVIGLTILIVKNWATISTAIGDAWTSVRTTTGETWAWVQAKVGGVVDWFQGIPGALRRAGKGMWSWITDGFKGAINGVAAAWNGFQLGPWTIGWDAVKVAGRTVIPGMHKTFGPFAPPDIPMLAEGGTMARGGGAFVADDGPELIELPTGARVTPLDRAGPEATRAGRAREVIQLVLDGKVVTEVVRDRLADISRRNGRRGKAA